MIRYQRNSKYYGTLFALAEMVDVAVRLLSFGFFYSTLPTVVAHKALRAAIKTGNLE
jgi:hypothetical protein